jgi:(p)ppGpp synthase/HD superfamily hydrolase
MNNIRQDDLVVRAVDFARNAHESINQLRKYSKEPYICHPLAVMEILLEHCTSVVTPEMLAAAANHDVVEDTPLSLDDVRQALGDQVADLVFWLTDVSKPADGNRRARKALDNAHTAAAPVAARNIKLADVIHNVKDITEHDPDFARVYIREKHALIDMIGDADPGLLAQAHAVIAECVQILGKRP